MMICKPCFDDGGQMPVFQFLVLSCRQNNGLVSFSTHDFETLHEEIRFDCSRPMYGVFGQQILYIILRAPHEKNSYSDVIALRKKGNGQYDILGEPVCTDGTVSCHIVVSPDTRYLYTANYLSGSISEMEIMPDGSVGKLNKVVVHKPEKEKESHVHGVFFTPDGRYLCAPDLGLDKIYLYAYNAGGILPEPSFIYTASENDGPRHLVFSADRHTLFSVNQTSLTIDVLRYSDRRLDLIKKYPAVRGPVPDGSTISAVRLSPDGKKLYAAVRGHDHISCFSVANETIELFAQIPCHGENPRDFDLSPDGRWLVCCNMNSSNIAVFHVHETGKLSFVCQTSVDKPMNVLYIPNG